MKRILSEFEYTSEQLNKISELAKECRLCDETVKILYSRGICDRQSVYDFLHPTKEHFISPFKMSGMNQAVELIKRAREESWVVVVFGDYDADGICASTIMYNSLKDFGLEPIVCVPERKNGYGLSIQLIDSIFEEYCPELFITVDCGISCVEEVEYLKEQGAEVIVTDHHELPEKLPDCICINPKINDGYLYDNLCGAGVAFKVGCALNGTDAYKYLDFAAIATVADSVPLTGENRDIVYEGLKIINSKPRSCYSQFINKTEEKVTAQTLAFSISPKINAAGRMGDAAAALELFNETDEKKIFDLAAKLTAYNIERQKCCDELYNNAKSMLKDQGVLGKIIMLYNDNWNSGFIGIVAARLAEEFARPAILFVKNGNTLKGSARSVENVNIFEALKACEEYITEFGGHSQAAGINVFVDDFESLKAALNEFISTHYSAEDFVPTVKVSGSFSARNATKLARELELLEPFGVGNRRPLFEMTAGAIPVRAVKTGSQHISIKNSGFEMMYFGGAKYTRLLESSAQKRLIFEYNVSSFRGKEYVKGFLRDIIYYDDAGSYATQEIAINNLNLLSLPETNCVKQYVSIEEIEEIMSNCGDYGTLFVASEYSTLKKFTNADKFHVDLFVLSSKNIASGILLSPLSDTDLSGYRTVVFLDRGIGVRLHSLQDKHVEVCNGISGKGFLDSVSYIREDLLKVFAAVAANAANLIGTTAEEVAQKNDLGCSVEQAFFALKVFEQLSLISFDGGRLTVFRGVKSELTNSVLYNAVKALKAE